MKQKYNGILILAILLGWMACSKIDNSYKDLVAPGGRVYVEKATAKAYAGYNSVQIVWPKTADPNVVKAKIYWNSFRDSVMVDISRDKDTIRKLITNLSEQYYTFIVKTFDKDNNSSVPVEVVGRAYGDQYISGLSNRIVLSSMARAGIITIRWANPTLYNGAIGTQIAYADKNGLNKTHWVQNNTNETILSDYKPGTEFTYRTVFRADSLAIDSLYTPLKTLTDIQLDKTLWKVTDFSDQEAVAHLPNGPAINIIDYDPGSFWHSRHSDCWGCYKYPHWITIDMTQDPAKLLTITKVIVDPRDDGLVWDFKNFIIKGDDGTGWKDYGSFTLSKTEKGAQTFTLPQPAKIRYIQIFMTGGGADFYSGLSEFAAIGN